MTTDPDGGDLVLLGEGPVATVLAGVDATTGEAYALKVFPDLLDRRTRAEVDAELGRLSALRPRAAILVAERTETLPDGRYALRMELCAQSLPELVESFGPLSVPDALVLGTVLAATLATAHRAGLVHGGVTPGNVLFRASGAPVLSDFGRTLRNAFPRDPLPVAEVTAPETVRDGSADERSDLYGLGVILHLALAGRVPHHGPPGEEQGKRLLRVLGTAVPPLVRPDAPAELVALVSELLAKEPDARPADAATVAERLDTLRRRVPSAEAATPAQTATDSSTMDRAAFDDFAGSDDFVGSDNPAPVPAKPSTSAPEPPLAPQPPPALSPEPLPVPVPVPESLPEALPSRVPESVPLPSGQPILVFGPEGRRWRRSRILLLTAGVGVAAVVVVTTALVVNRPDELIVPMPPDQSAAASRPAGAGVASRIELADPTDRGNVVELSWRSSEPMDFAVVVAGEGEPTKVLLAQRNTTFRVPVDPVRKYCFQVQGSDGVRVLESEAKPVRGAKCVG